MQKTIAALAIVVSGLASAVSAGSPTPALADPDVTDAAPTVVLGGTVLTTGAVAGTLLALAAVAAIANGSSGTAATTTTTN